MATKGEIVLHLFLCTEWSGDPYAKEGQPGGLVWTTSHELEHLPMMPLDVPLIPTVRAAMLQHASR